MNCHAETIRNYIKRYPALREIQHEIIENNLDIAESKLLEANGRGEIWTVWFYLETRRKHRGYSRRFDVADAPGQPLVLTDARKWIEQPLREMAAKPASGRRATMTKSSIDDLHMTASARSVCEHWSTPEPGRGAGLGFNLSHKNVLVFITDWLASTDNSRPMIDDPVTSLPVAAVA